MKYFLSFLLPFLAFYQVFCQDCPPGVITFTSQEQIDNFSATYPDCTNTRGAVQIEEGEQDIVDLSGLSQLTSIRGYLSFFRNDNLLNLEGLENLTSIGGYLSFFQNENLINLEGLENLTSIGSQLILTDNDNIASLTGLENLTSVQGIYLAGNVQLIDLNALSQITSLESYLYIDSQPFLTSLSGLHNITSIEGNLTVYTNRAISDLSDFSNLTHIGGSLNIAWSDGLTDLSGLENIQNIGANLRMESNENIDNLNGLQNVTSIGGSIILIFNNSLSDLSQLSNLEAINGRLRIESNSNLNSLEGLENIDPTTVTDLRIRNCNTLSECSVTSICDYLMDPNNTSNINTQNEEGCNSREQILANCTVLPIELINFTGKKYEDKIELYWQAYANNNIKQFEIQRSKNGKDWKSIGFKKPTYTVETKTYYFLDNNPYSAKNYYRLKQTGIDNNSSFSNIIIVGDLEKTDIVLFPNPANDYLNLIGLEEGNVKILNSLGQLVENKSFKGSTISISALPSGLYIFHFELKDRTVVKKITKH